MPEGKVPDMARGQLGRSVCCGERAPGLCEASIRTIEVTLLDIISKRELERVIFCSMFRITRVSHERVIVIFNDY